MSNVVITSAARTAVGSFLGSFSNVPAHELGSVEEVVARSESIRQKCLKPLWVKF